MSGILEAVDLRPGGKFRLIDDIGNRITLDQVPQPEAVAHLIGRRVSAVGPATTDVVGRVRSVTNPAITDTPVPESWRMHANADLTAELAKPGPVPGGGAEFTDEEYAEFLSFLKT
ncbi:MAG: hypothetical protein ACRCXL_16495 [Dermatophilaceae bacterium]